VLVRREVADVDEPHAATAHAVHLQDQGEPGEGAEDEDREDRADERPDSVAQGRVVDSDLAGAHLPVSRPRTTVTEAPGRV
jgi:hypothetical protein